MKTFKQYLNEDISRSVLNNLETYLDKLYKSLGVDVEFSKHFHDRLNDPRNVKSIGSKELIRLFKHAKDKHGTRIKKMNHRANAVISDMETDVNMPFKIKVIKGKDNIDLELAPKTIMRKHYSGGVLIEDKQQAINTVQYPFTEEELQFVQNGLK